MKAPYPNLPEFPDVPWRLIVRSFSGESSEAETQEFREWIAADPLRNEFVESLRTIWQNTGKLPMQIDVEKIIRGVSEKAGFSTNRSFMQRRQFPTHSRLGFIFRIAAAIVLLVGVPFATYHYFGEKEQQLVTREVSTEKGQRAKIRFVDGTVVSLNAASLVRFQQRFANGAREVYLQGEAYFDVVHLDGAPFIVRTDRAVVRVLGTKFNVQAWPEDKTVQVVVAQGKVAFKTDSGVKPQEVLLTEGLSSRLTSNGSLTAPGQVNVSGYLSWLEGGMVFESTPLSEVARTLERRFDITCQISDGQIMSLPLTVAFKDEALPEVLKAISLSLDIDYKRDGKNVKFFSRRSKQERITKP